MVLNIVIYIGNMLKKKSIAIIIMGFFGIKNLLFIGFLALLWQTKFLDSDISALLIASYYGIYSVVLGLKMLNAEYQND